jgi:hypothetical protein
VTASTTRTGLGSGTFTEVFVGLVWLGTTAMVARAGLTGDLGLTGALEAAAKALPGLVGAAIFTGATIASAAAGRRPAAGTRLLLGLGAGVVFGLAAAVAVRYGYGSSGPVTHLALVVGAGSVLGGLVAALPESVREAVLWATTWVFFAGVMSGVIALSVGPAGPDFATSQDRAAVLYGYAVSVATGLIAGVYSGRKLSAERRARAWYPVAAALPGAVLLAAEGLTRLGGVAWTGVAPATRLRHALIVVGVGLVVGALFALRRRQPE